jgi:hypothetical protein
MAAVCMPAFMRPARTGELQFATPLVLSLSKDGSQTARPGFDRLSPSGGERACMGGERVCTRR